jgi:hypothetical protein
VKAITFTQPWGGLVASGIKKIENRPRNIVRRDDFGKRFAIHASREIDESVYERIADIDPQLDPPVATHGYHEQPWQRLSRIKSAVIGTARIVGVAGTDQPCDPEQRRWFFGPIGYILDDIIALDRAIPCKGMLGFWTLPADVEAQIQDEYLRRGLPW